MKWQWVGTRSIFWEQLGILCGTSEYLFVKLFRQRHVHQIKIKILLFLILYTTSSYYFQPNHSKSKYPTQRSEQHIYQCNSNSVIHVSLQ